MSKPNLVDSRKQFDTKFGFRKHNFIRNDRKKKNIQFLELKSILAAKVLFGRTVERKKLMENLLICF
jgi:hypothetical protein